MVNAESKAITVKQLADLVRKQGYRCAYTGFDLTPEEASLGHIVPLARNGPHTIGNLAVVRCEVNLAKGSLTYDEFLAMCRAVVDHADRLDEQKRPEANREQRSRFAVG